MSVSTNFDRVPETDDIYKSHRLEVLFFEEKDETDFFTLTRNFQFIDAYPYVSYVRICKAKGKKEVLTLEKNDKIDEYWKYYAVDHHNDTFIFMIYR